MDTTPPVGAGMAQNKVLLSTLAWLPTKAPSSWPTGPASAAGPVATVTQVNGLEGRHKYGWHAIGAREFPYQVL